MASAEPNLPESVAGYRTFKLGQFAFVRDE